MGALQRAYIVHAFIYGHCPISSRVIFLHYEAFSSFDYFVNCYSISWHDQFTIVLFLLFTEYSPLFGKLLKLPIAGALR